MTSGNTAHLLKLADREYHHLTGKPAPPSRGPQRGRGVLTGKVPHAGVGLSYKMHVT